MLGEKPEGMSEGTAPEAESTAPENVTPAPEAPAPEAEPTASEIPAPMAEIKPEETKPEEPKPDTPAEVKVDGEEEIIIEEAGVKKVDSKELDPLHQAMEEALDASFNLKRGNIVDCTVMQVGEDELLVSFGGKTEGFIPKNEALTDRRASLKDNFNEGDTFEAEIIHINRNHENIYLSKKRRDIESLWGKFEDSVKTGEAHEGLVVKANNGGLLVDVGITAFMPHSHIARNRIRNPEVFLNKKVRFKVIEVDRPKGRLVISRKEQLETEEAERKEQLFEQLNVGDIVEGKVHRIVDYGAFISLGGGVRGLLHISEVSWVRVNDVSKILKEGQKIKVKILRIDPSTEKISLGYKQTKANPWERVDQELRTGEIHQVEVLRVVDFGAFVRVKEDYEGLILTGELDAEAGKRPKDTLKPGTIIEAAVVDIDKRRKRIKLSATRVGEIRERQDVSEYLQTQKKATTTLGDALGGILDDLELTPVPEEAPAEETPVVEEAPAVEETVEEPAAEEAPATEEVPAEETPAEEPAAEEAPAEQEAPVEETPAEEPAAEEAPAEQEAPAEETPAEEPAAEEAPAEEEAPVEQTPAEEEAPVEETPAEEEAPVEETPAEEPAVEEPAAEEAPAEQEAPAEETPAEEPAAEEAPAEEEPKADDEETPKE